MERKGKYEKRVNAYSFTIFKNGRIFYRRGIPACLRSNKLTINGVGTTELFIKPVEVPLDMPDKKLVDLFANFRKSEPLVGIEDGNKVYVYGLALDTSNLYLRGPATSHEEYLLIEGPSEYAVHILGEARVVFRLYEGATQRVMIAISGACIIDLEDEAGRLVMIEPVGERGGERRFVTR